jgi:hypothetical protein
LAIPALAFAHRFGSEDGVRNYSKKLTSGYQRDSMATAQAFCNLCQSKVSAETVLTDDALREALARDEDITVMHVFVDEDGSSGDHIWRLNRQDEENLRKYLGCGLS